MPKQPVKTNGDANHKPPVIVSSTPPAHLADYAEFAGAGTSQAAEDNLVPLLYVLTYQSPQCERRDGKYVEGAEPGDLWLRNAPSGLEIAKTSNPEFPGLLVQPCDFFTDWGEWLPRPDGGGGGAGFIGRHPNKKIKDKNGIVNNAPDVPGAQQDPENKFHWTTADGQHDLVETRNYPSIIYTGGRALAYNIVFTSTGHATAKSWMVKINQKIIEKGPNAGRAYPIYTSLYRLKTEPRSNQEGRWFGIVVEDHDWATAEQAAAGRKLHDQFRSGEKVAEAPVEAAQAAESTGRGGEDMQGDNIPF